MLGRQALQGMCCRCWNRHHKSLLALLEFGALAASKGCVTTLSQCLPINRATWGVGRRSSKITGLRQCFLYSGSPMSWPQAGQALEETNKERGEGKRQPWRVVNLLAKSAACTKRLRQQLQLQGQSHQNPELSSKSGLFWLSCHQRASVCCGAHEGSDPQRWLSVVLFISRAPGSSVTPFSSTPGIISATNSSQLTCGE